MNARFAKQLVTKMFALESHCSMGTNFELQKKNNISLFTQTQTPRWYTPGTKKNINFVMTYMIYFIILSLQK